MEDFEAEEKEARELAERFKAMVESGTSVFFDSEEMEIIIDELMRQMDMPMASEAIEYAITCILLTHFSESCVSRR
ncbi:MAG: hypothetical protein IKO62_09280 [Bacteroidales bacterium]|nr:hypothetical protein [Bacteroidales bacterium]